MTRRRGIYGKKGVRAAASGLKTHGGATQPSLCPPRPSQEKAGAETMAAHVWNSLRRKPTLDEENEAINTVYYNVYPEGPHQIPSPDHPCAKRWMNIRVHFNSEIKRRLLAQKQRRSTITALPKPTKPSKQGVRLPRSRRRRGRRR